MTDRVWYFAAGGNRQGPISEDQLQAKIASGEVRADTLVWNSGMADWGKAADVPGLIGAGAPPLLPGAPALPRTVSTAVADGGQTGQALATTVGTWALFGRFLVVVIGSALVIPTPWVMTWFYRWFFPQIEMPDGRRVTFEGEPQDIWYIFMGRSLIAYAQAAYRPVSLLLLLLLIFIDLTIIRWVTGKLRWQGQREPLRFTGTYIGLLGWFALFVVSLISIVGWAWVTTAATRWICRNIEDPHEQLSFVASGWQVLWRFVVFTIACAFIIPIPWMVAWLTRWMISQFHLSQRA